ncbi:MAG: formyltransferase family protein [Dermatophilaceae bacterium]
MIPEKVLFVGDNSRWSELAADYLRRTFTTVETVLWDYGDEKPDVLNTWHGDRIFCFKADLILDARTLGQATKTAINFHPAIPKYRGIGGYDYVIHEGGSEFGVTCHHMVTKIDAGPIIVVRRFAVLPSESVASLRDRAAAHCLLLFQEIVHRIRSGTALPTSDERWGATLYTRAMLEEFYRTRAGYGSAARKDHAA